MQHLDKTRQDVHDDPLPEVTIPLFSSYKLNSHLKIIIKRKRPPILIDLLLPSLLLRHRTRHHASLLIIPDALLKEIRLARQTNRLHEIERVSHLIVLLIAQRDEQAISHELDILLHERGIHAQQATGQGLGEEFLLDGDGFGDDVLHGLAGGSGVEVGEEEAGEVGVHALVAGDEFVGEGEPGHEAALLEPEDGGEGAGEEDAFDGGEGDEALREGGFVVGDPF